MTLNNQLGATSSSRKSTKKSNRQQKKSSTTTPPPKDDFKKKQKKPSGTTDRKDTPSPSQDSSLQRGFSFRKQISNLVNSGGSSLKRSLSFGKGLNERALRKPWNASLQSLREDVPTTDEDRAVFFPDVRDRGAAVFDSRKPVTRTQSLLVKTTRTEDAAYAKNSKVSCYLYLASDFQNLKLFLSTYACQFCIFQTKFLLNMGEEFCKIISKTQRTLDRSQV